MPGQDEILTAITRLETKVSMGFGQTARRLDHINGCIADHEKRLVISHTDLALLKQAQRTGNEAFKEERQEQKGKWEKVWNIAVLPILMAVIGGVIVLVFK